MSRSPGSSTASAEAASCPRDSKPRCTAVPPSGASAADRAGRRGRRTSADGCRGAVRVLPGLAIDRGRTCRQVVVLARHDSTARPLGLHFGMTGRLVVDDHAAIDRARVRQRSRRPGLGPADRPLRRRRGACASTTRVAGRASISIRMSGALGPDFLSIGSDGAGCSVRSPADARRSRRCCWTSRSSPGSATCASTRCCGRPESRRP